MGNASNRIKWVDIVRCIGIFLIYVSHFNSVAGLTFPFAFTHHVPLFFLISGCMENLRSETGIRSTIHNTIKTILIPWFFYSILSIIIYVILSNSYSEVSDYLISVATGTIRNQFFASALWFLTCIAVVRILFSFLRKLHNKFIILLISIGMFYISEYALSYRPFITPSMPYNIDSAMYYMIFYAIGYTAFPFMCKALESHTLYGKILLGLSALASGIFTVLLFFEKNLFSYLPSIQISVSIQSIFCPLIIVWFYCTVAKQLENISILCLIGRNTLHLCGNEYVIKTLFPALLGTLGLTTYLGNPLYVYVYNAILLVVAVYFLIPFEKKILNKIANILHI